MWSRIFINNLMFVICASMLYLGEEGGFLVWRWFQSFYNYPLITEAMNEQVNEWIKTHALMLFLSLWFPSFSLQLNHFPGSFQLGRKDRLWRNLSRMQVSFGKKEFGFFPQTYILPQDMKQLKRSWEDATARQKWIIKPVCDTEWFGFSFWVVFILCNDIDQHICSWCITLKGVLYSMSVICVEPC